MDRAALNEAAKLAYRDPEVALRELRAVELVVATSDISPHVKHLRTNALKGPREYRQAALFCYGMSKRIGLSVRFCPIEASDYDFIATWGSDQGQHFAPVQLKELVPESLNGLATLQGLVDGLVKYSSASLTVAVFLNRRGRLPPSELTIPSLQISALWFVFAAAEDQAEWGLYGNVLEDASATAFTYPA